MWNMVGNVDVECSTSRGFSLMKVKWKTSYFIDYQWIS